MGGGLVAQLLLGGAGLAVLALGMVLVRRRRAQKAAEEEELAAGIAAAQAGEADTAAPSPAATETALGDAASDSIDEAPSSLFDEDLDLSDLETDTAASADGSDGGEKDETVDEAEVYLAYGLHQQAEDLLRLALQEHPQRADYHEKLLETLFAAGKSDEFVAAAGEFRQQVGEPPAAAWQRVAAMGQQIAPDSAVFSGASGAAASVAAAAAPGETTGGDDLDFDLDLGTADSAASGEDLPDSPLSEGAAGRDLDEAVAPASSAGNEGNTDDDLVFDLSDLDEAQPGEAASSEAPATAGSSDYDHGLDFDATDLGGASSSGGDSAAPAAATATEPNEPEGLDFDIGDLGDLDSGSESGSAEAPAAEPKTADVDDDLAFSLEDALGLDDSDDSDDTGTSPSDNEFDFSDLESALESTDSGESAAGTDAGLDESLDLDTGDDATEVVDFDLGAFEEGVAESAGPGEQPAGGVASADAGETDEDLATMIDLAKAYIDMGDAESASNALEEVIAGGSEEQRAEARSLLETVQ